MIGADDLWRSILQYAVQGKLVPQDPNDEPASVLIDRVREEKPKLVKEGKIKKEKNVSIGYHKVEGWFESSCADCCVKESQTDDYLPPGWAWASLSQIGCLIRGSGIKRDDVRSFGKPCIRYGELYTTYELKTTAVKSFISSDLFDKCKKITYGEAILTLTGECKEDIGKTVVYLGTEEVACGGDLLLIKYHSLDPIFLSYLLNSPKLCLYKAEYSNGDAIVHLSVSQLSSLLLPIPPLSEQQRIVAKIEELRPLVDRYRELDKERCALDESISSLLRKSILQYAVQGKLVPQDSNDEPASVLLDRVREEKQRLIQEGKIKKEKNASRIYRKDGVWFESDGKEEKEIEVPFEIPDNWGWSRIIQFGNVVGGGTPNTAIVDYWDGDIPWITPADMRDINGYYVSRGKRMITIRGLSESSAQLMPAGSIVFSSRAPIGYVAIAANDLSTNQGFKSLVLYYQECSYYLYYVLKALTPSIEANASGTTFKEISAKEFGSILIPIPPLSEQQRIVAKIEELRPLLDRYRELEREMRA